MWTLRILVGLLLLLLILQWAGMRLAMREEGEIANLDRLHRAGFRMLGLAHFFDNELAGSAHDMERRGLTTLGRQVIGLARNGGVAGIGPWPGATCGKTLEAYFQALDHAVAVAGIDHVGLGSDFDGNVVTPIDAAQWVQVTAGLLARGYAEAEIRRLMGGNVERVLLETLPDAD